MSMRDYLNEVQPYIDELKRKFGWGSTPPAPPQPPQQSAPPTRPVKDDPEP
jgi:hypothetical protein